MQFVSIIFLTIFYIATARENSTATFINGGKRVVGGTTANVGRYPYYTYLLIHKNGQTYSCGGTLVHKDIVMTAAHCDGDRITTWVGLASKRDFGSAHKREMISKKIYSSYGRASSGILHHDIMLIKLESEVPVVPVKLNSNSNKPADAAVVQVVGLGRDNSKTNSVPDDLQLAEVRAQKFSYCNYIYSNNLVESHHLCTHASGKDSCSGDSGGPIIINGGNSNDDIQVGVVSFSMGCANRIVPSVNTRVSTYIQWIDNSICGMTSYSPGWCSGGRSSRVVPTFAPTPRPTDFPTLAPTPLPTWKPTPRPTPVPTAGAPSTLPSEDPSPSPSRSPSTSPSSSPTGEESAPPSDFPSSSPTGMPSYVPSSTPSVQPSSVPSSTPSGISSESPTSKPSFSPTLSHQPSLSTQPTEAPSVMPSASPTSFPSVTPSHSPTVSPQPSISPSISLHPTVSNAPTESPAPTQTTKPSFSPTNEFGFLFERVIPNSLLDLCPELDGPLNPDDACDDYPICTFDLGDGMGREKCIWLAARPEHHGTYCVPGNEAFVLCPETCGMCRDECEDAPNEIFFDILKALNETVRGFPYDPTNKT